jgi:hypothetical protein
VSYILPSIVPEGLTLLVGRPKIGKSWLLLDTGVAVADEAPRYVCGNRPAHGDVLYLALEDNKRRLQWRIRKLLGEAPWPERLRLHTSWRRLDQGGAEDIEAWCDSVPEPRLVILDTLAACRPHQAGNRSGYSEDYDALKAVQALAGERGLGVIAAHHDRKMGADDPIDRISGTLGLPAIADTALVLTRSSDGITLYGRGRDIEEFEYAVAFEKEECRWRLRGDAEEVRRSDTRKAILSALPETGDVMGPTEIAKAAGRDDAATRQALGRMATAGEVVRTSRGKYRLPEKTLV